MVQIALGNLHNSTKNSQVILRFPLLDQSDPTEVPDRYQKKEMKIVIRMAEGPVKWKSCLPSLKLIAKAPGMPTRKMSFLLGMASW